MAKTKVDIISGFLGAGKTTFIRKLLKDAVAGEQVVLIENEFGEIGIDGGFLKDSGIEIREMNSGCICCSLVGDFASSLQEILTKYKPDRIIIEPSGVGKLSDVMKAVADVEADLEVENNSAVTVVDAKKCRLYMKNFGEFFNNQVQFATTIVLSRTDIAKQEVIDEAVAMIRELNPTATIITTPVALLSGKKLLEILEEPVDLKAELMKQVMEEEEEHEHHHHHHEDEDEHGHHHHHHDDDDDDDEDEHEHHHHHHDDDDDDDHDHEHEHEHHHHHHGEECSCGHHHHHHHGHDADEVFQSWGLEQVPPISEERLRGILEKLANTDEFGTVIRCKGMVPTKTQTEWLYFDLVPGETEVRIGIPEYTGKVCVIGSDLKEDLLEKEFKG
ncbi:MAG: cobalamin biosynthesis protein CobW [Stomatobaculum sp.]|jgi:G3E family GTPase|nr:cobalamin biosynthesis protein CobW [Stomatobaculum sp.]